MEVVNNFYYYWEKNWILSEVRVFHFNLMVYSCLNVIDCNTNELVQDEIDDVWIYDWKPMN
jgi:hypothetical protein